MIAWAVLLSVAGQLSATMQMGAIAGRVCLDENGDGQCSGSEPGLSGLPVSLENGLLVFTDANGQFHIAGVEARQFDAMEAPSQPRVRYGRHRLKVDIASLGPGMVALPDAVTLEVPMGGLATQNFAIRKRSDVEVGRAEKGSAVLGRLNSSGMQIELQVRASATEKVWVNGAWAERVSDQTHQAWVAVVDGTNRIPVRIDSGSDRTRFVVETIEVIRRGKEVLVVPISSTVVAVVSMSELPFQMRSLSIAVREGTHVQVDSQSVTAGKSGVVRVSLGAKTAGQNFNLRIVTPDGVVIESELNLEPPNGISLVGLLDVEASFRFSGGPRPFGFAGRGAGSLRGRYAGFNFSGELDLRDSDFREFSSATASGLLMPRNIQIFERGFSAIEQPPAWADESVTATENPAGARVRAEISRAGLGRIGFGNYRLMYGSDAEVGRTHRSLTAAYLELQSPKNFLVQGGVRGAFAPSASDAALGVSLRQAHERFEATGGSLFYLANPAVMGSERVRIEYLDGVTGLPISERHLSRGVDYSIDPQQGRILLARPLWAYESDLNRTAASPQASLAPVLWVDYETVVTGPASGSVYGGEAEVSVGRVRIRAGGVSQPNSILWSASAAAKLGPIWLGVEGAHNIGRNIDAAPAWSDDGGLSFWDRRVERELPRDGWALTARARGLMLFGRGHFDLSWRHRTPGFADAQHLDVVAFRQIAARVSQPIGSFTVGGYFDDRVGEDWRQAWTGLRLYTRVIGGSVAYQRESWSVALEGRDVEVNGGGRTSASVAGRWAVNDRLTLLAGYRHMLMERNGGFNDTFASLGAELKATQNLTFGVRGGWGPKIGPQVWGNTTWVNGNEVFYGGHSFDVDAPTVDTHRVVTGARRQLDDGTAVYVEDAAAHDVTALRVSRAVGVSRQLGRGFTISARYERGVRQLFEMEPLRQRDAGGVSLSWVGNNARVWVRGEARSERGGVNEPLWQWLAWGGAEFHPTDRLHGVLSATFSHSTSNGTVKARFFEALAALAWRFDWGLTTLRYTLRRELKPGLNVYELIRHRLSLLPSIKLSDRFSLYAGGHLQHDEAGFTAIASLRPTVRVVGGLEAGVEGALSSMAIAGSIYAARAEIGYRFNSSFLLAVGATLLGFNGLDATPMDASLNSSSAPNRLYVRAEAAY